MEYFFDNNIYMIFAFILYSILIKEKPNEENKKVIVIYSFIAMLSVFKILDIKKMLIICLLCLFIYFEILIDDYFKLKIIKKVRYKIFDFLYLLIFKYMFVLFVISLLIISNLLTNFIILPTLLKYLLFICIFLYIIFFICNNEFELYSFSHITETLNKKVNFGRFEPVKQKHAEILLYIEDKSFFDRPNNYTIVCWAYIKHRIYRVNNVLYKIRNNRLSTHKIVNIIRFIKYAFGQFIKQLQDLPKFIRRIFRGHSTIEMQLFRSVAVKSGYYKILQRKIAEYIYTPIFFAGLKDYYKLNYQKVSNGYYKNYILVCYLNFAPVFYKGRGYSNVYDMFNNKKTLTNSDFLIYVLGLSGKLNSNIETLTYYGDLFNIKAKQINKSLESIKK